MARSLWNDWRAVWLVRSRAVWSDIGFWLILAGYSTRTRKVENPLYMVYALLFFALWIFMVLMLLADVSARFLLSLPFASPQAAAVGVGSLAVLGLFLIELNQAAGRSPFRFSEADAHLLCATPVDRRPVALLWLLSAWFERGLAFWAGAVVLGYALMQAQSPRELTAADLPVYLVAGARMFSVAVLLQLAALALAWAAGAWRLHGRREQANLRWVSPALAILLAAGVLGGLMNVLLSALRPLTFAIQAGLGLVPWTAGWGLALLSALVGVGVLLLLARGMSLARAAQETRDREAIQAARLAGSLDLADELAQRERLRGGRSPSRIPVRPGAGALVWKNIVQAGRRFGLGDLLGWLAITALVVGMLALPGWQAKAGAGLIWLLLASRQLVAPLRRDLSRWWIFRQLPLRYNRSVTDVISLPVVVAWLAGLVGLLIALALGSAVPPVSAWLYLVGVPSLAFAVAVDVLRQVKSHELLAGRVPDLTMLAVVLGLLVIVLEGGFAWLLLVRWAVPFAAALPFIITENLGVLYLAWQAAGDFLRRAE